MSVVEHVFDKAPMSYINQHRKRRWQEGKAEGYEDKFVCSVHNQSLLTFNVHNGLSFHFFGRVLGKHNSGSTQFFQFHAPLIQARARR